MWLQVLCLVAQPPKPHTRLRNTGNPSLRTSSVVRWRVRAQPPPVRRDLLALPRWLAPLPLCVWESTAVCVEQQDYMKDALLCALFRAQRLLILHAKDVTLILSFLKFEKIYIGNVSNQLKKTNNLTLLKKRFVVICWVFFFPYPKNCFGLDLTISPRCAPPLPRLPLCRAWCLRPGETRGAGSMSLAAHLAEVTTVDTSLRILRSLITNKRAR